MELALDRLLHCVTQLKMMSFRSRPLFVGWIAWPLATIGVPLGRERERDAGVREQVIVGGHNKESEHQADGFMSYSQRAWPS